MLSDNWWFDGVKEAWHISTSAFLKEEIRKSRLVARMLPKFGPPYTTGAIGGGSSASATAILRFVSPQMPNYTYIDAVEVARPRDMSRNHVVSTEYAETFLPTEIYR
ncbi:hypothetical protein ALC56_01736 [Trachymyrmex septentrionalis]|uniref:Uncharacterized protein n=1 Tax=Trachymyrmex septentrionalis TaxID=34720 RepID=A0A195FTW0_9HYME|nr:hypothetical protein ALC56_01736 [Trachymyrmex septentrionalis]